MPDYQKGKIYKLWSPQGNEIYIGSTINPLAKRFGQHKTDGNCNSKNCNSKYLFENYDDVRIELIELYPCNSKMELNKKEGEHIRENECLNKRIAGRTPKEWYEDNREHIQEYKKEYREDNKEKIKEWKNQKFNCECGSVIRINDKSKHFKTNKHTKFMNSHPSH